MRVVSSRGYFGRLPNVESSSSYFPIELFSLLINCDRIARSRRLLRALFSASLLNTVRYTGLPGFTVCGNPLVALIEMSSSCSRAKRMASPLSLKRSDVRTWLYGRAPSSELAMALIRCQACSRDQCCWASDSEPRMKTLRISEDDCSMIRFTAPLVVSNG